MKKHLLLVVALLAASFVWSRAEVSHPGPVRWTCSLAVCFAYHDDGEIISIKKFGTLHVGDRP